MKTASNPLRFTNEQQIELLRPLVERLELEDGGRANAPKKMPANPWGGETHNGWRTPPKLVRELGYRYGPWDLDAAAESWNAQCSRFITPEQDAFRTPWAGRVWLNPEYSPAGTIARWMARSRQQALHNVRVVRVGNLVPHYTAEGWWRRYVTAAADLGQLLAVDFFADELGDTYVRRYSKMEISEVRIAGRLSFTSKEGQHDSARYSSAFVVYERRQR